MHIYIYISLTNFLLAGLAVFSSFYSTWKLIVLKNVSLCIGRSICLCILYVVALSFCWHCSSNLIFSIHLHTWFSLEIATLFAHTIDQCQCGYHWNSLYGSIGCWCITINFRNRFLLICCILVCPHLYQPVCRHQKWHNSGRRILKSVRELSTATVLDYHTAMVHVYSSFNSGS